MWWMRASRQQHPVEALRCSCRRIASHVEAAAVCRQAIWKCEAADAGDAIAEVSGQGQWLQ